MRYKVLQKKPTKQNTKSDIIDGLARSEKVAGQLQPALLDKNGNVIDGLHRLTANPSWRTQRLDWVTTEKDRIIAKLHSNYRRTVSKQELSRDFVRMAKILLSEKKLAHQKDASSAISKLVPYTERYVRELLPDEFKHTEFRTISRLKEEQVPPRGLDEEKAVDETPSPRASGETILASGMLSEEYFTIEGVKCTVNWELRKVWSFRKA